MNIELVTAEEILENGLIISKGKNVFDERIINYTVLYMGRVCRIALKYIDNETAIVITKCVR